MWMDLDSVIAICVKVSRRVGLSPHKSPPVLLVYSTFSSKTFEITYINMDLEPHHFFSWGQTAPEHTRSMIDVHTTKKNIVYSFYTNIERLNSYIKERVENLVDCSVCNIF